MTETVLSTARRGRVSGLALLLACSLLASGPVRAGDINTASITAATTLALPLCLKWMPIGTCIWLDCGLDGCGIKTSLKIGHYNPDFVVSAYHNTVGNPWLEARLAYGPPSYLAGQGIITGLSLGTFIPLAGGNRGEDTTSRDHRNLMFKEADVIGHPTASLTSLAAEIASLLSGSLTYLCRSEATSFFPYFLSPLDALAWRWGIPETIFPQALIPGLREIGNFPLNTWGAVYPRHGFVTQAEGPKAAAVAAQRAGDIVTRRFQPHVYVPVRGGIFTYTWIEWVERELANGIVRMPIVSGQRVWRPPPLMERGFSTWPARRSGLWQILTPNVGMSCGAFGVNDTLSLWGWAAGKVDAGEDYAWTLWRPYKCCRRRGMYLYSIDLIPYPP